ncbi:hypothetical protein pb186bvf_019710 [Paramecium bursaria]
MGCLQSRDTFNKVPIQKQNDNQILNYLNKGFYETILVRQTIYNYQYLPAQKAWSLRKMIAIESIDFYSLQKVYQSQFDQKQQKNLHVILKPIQDIFPLRPKNVNSTFTLQKGDVVPKQILAPNLINQIVILTFQQSKKFSLVYVVDMAVHQNVRKLVRFHQLCKHKIQQSQKLDIFVFLANFNKELWSKLSKQIDDLLIYVYQDPQVETHLPNITQVFNIFENNAMLVTSYDIIYYISDGGTVIRVEKPDFYMPEKQQTDQSQENKLRCLAYEKKILKEIKSSLINSLSMKKAFTQPIFRRQGTSMKISHDIFVSESDLISQNQYKDYKYLMMSEKLNRILRKYDPGEEFQIELEKIQVFYSVEKAKFQNDLKLYKIPSIFPHCSKQRKKLVCEIEQELSECIGLRWKSPDFKDFSSDQKYTINKIVIADIVNLKLEKYLKVRSNLLIQKTNQFLLKKTPVTGNQFYSLEKFIESSVDKSINNESKSQCLWISQTHQYYQFNKKYEMKLRIEVESLEQIFIIQQLKQESLHNNFKLTLEQQLLNQLFDQGIDFKLELGQKIIPLQGLIQDQPFAIIIPSQDPKIYLEALEQTQIQEVYFLSKEIVPNYKHLMIVDEQFEKLVVQQYFNHDPQRHCIKFLFNNQGYLQSIGGPTNLEASQMRHVYSNQKVNGVQRTWKEVKQLVIATLSERDTCNAIKEQMEKADEVCLYQNVDFIWDEYNYEFKKIEHHIQFREGALIQTSKQLDTINSQKQIQDSNIIQLKDQQEEEQPQNLYQQFIDDLRSLCW